MEPPRKIDLPECCISIGGHYGGNENCDHDYPPESRQLHDEEYYSWRCSKCGMKSCYEISQ